jgi:hypothetical protein
MEIATEKIDEAVLALLYLTLHDGARAWKGFDWDAMNRLHKEGFIFKPVGKAKSVLLTVWNGQGARHEVGVSALNQRREVLDRGGTIVRMPIYLKLRFLR